MVRGHPRSSAMSPFDRATYDSYFVINKTMRLSCTVFETSELLVKIRQHLPTSPASGATVGGGPVRISKKMFGIRKQESLGYRVVLFACSYI